MMNPAGEGHRFWENPRQELFFAHLLGTVLSATIAFVIFDSLRESICIPENEENQRFLEQGRAKWVQEKEDCFKVVEQTCPNIDLLPQIVHFKKGEDPFQSVTDGSLRICEVQFSKRSEQLQQKSLDRESVFCGSPFSRVLIEIQTKILPVLLIGTVLINPNLHLNRLVHII